MIIKSGQKENFYWATMAIGSGSKKKHQVVDWCLDHFGIDNPGAWFCAQATFYFWREEDFILFALRWS